MSEDAHDRLVSKIASASLSPNPWAGLLTEITAFAGARGACVIPLHGTPHRIEATESLGRLFEDYVADGWIDNDYRYKGVATMLRRGIMVDQDFVDHDTMGKEPYYESFLGRHGFRFFAGLGLHEGSESWVVALQRRRQDGHFDDDEQERLLRLVGPLQNAVAISRALSDAHALGDVDALSRRSVACVLLDRFGRVAYLNSVAETLVGTAFDVRLGRLTFRSNDATCDVERRVRAALSVTGDATAAPVMVRDGTSSMAVRVMRLAGTYDSVFRRHGVLVEVTSLQGRIHVDRASVSNAYGLTPREADLLASMLRTASLVAAAKDLGMSHETARSHLKSLFAKTGTSTQAGLVSLMAGVASVSG